MKHLKLLIGIVISVGAAWLAVKDIQFSKVGDTLGNLNWWWVLLSMIPFFIILLLKVTRWQLLFHPGPQVSLHRLFATLMMSYLFNTVLPARLGEVVRAYALSRSEKIGPVRVLSTILLEKILDVMMMFIFLIGLLPFLQLGNDIKQAAFVTGGVVIAAFLTCMLMAAYRKQAEQLIQWFLKWLPGGLRTRLFGLVTEVLDVLEVLLKFKLSLNLWAQTLLIWVLVVCNYMAIAFALGIPLTFELALVLTIVINLGMVVPSAPGYIGVFEALVLAALLPFFPGQESVLFSYGLFLHIVDFLPVVLLGMLYTSREGINIGKVSKKDLETPTAEPTPTSVPTPALADKVSR